MTDEKTMLLSIDDLQKELRVSKVTAYNLTKRPGFPVVRIGSRILINRNKLQQWLDEQTN